MYSLFFQQTVHRKHNLLSISWRNTTFCKQFFTIWILLYCFVFAYAYKTFINIQTNKQTIFFFDKLFCFQILISFFFFWNGRVRWSLSGTMQFSLCTTWFLLRLVFANTRVQLLRWLLSTWWRVVTPVCKYVLTLISSLAWKCMNKVSHSCFFKAIIPSTDHGNVAFNNETLSITFLPPLYQVGINIVPSTTKRGVEQGPTLACEFGSEVQPATVLDSNTIQCTIAQSFAERTVNLTVLYNGYRLASPVPFTYVGTSWKLNNFTKCIKFKKI